MLFLGHVGKYCILWFLADRREDWYHSYVCTVSMKLQRNHFSLISFYFVCEWYSVYSPIQYCNTNFYDSDTILYAASPTPNQTFTRFLMIHKNLCTKLDLNIKKTKCVHLYMCTKVQTSDVPNRSILDPYKGWINWHCPVLGSGNLVRQ